MRLYKFESTPGQAEERPSFFGTRDEAHQVAKNDCIGAQSRDECRIYEQELDTDKGSIISLLMGNPQYENSNLRRWKLSARGGLVELDSEDRPLNKGL